MSIYDRSHRRDDVVSALRLVVIERLGWEVLTTRQDRQPNLVVRTTPAVSHRTCTGPKTDLRFPQSTAWRCPYYHTSLPEHSMRAPAGRLALYIGFAQFLFCSHTSKGFNG